MPGRFTPLTGSAGGQRFTPLGGGQPPTQGGGQTSRFTPLAPPTSTDTDLISMLRARLDNPSADSGGGGDAGTAGLTSASPTFGYGANGLGPLGGFNLGNAGPISFGVSPLGALGANLNINTDTFGNIGLPLGSFNPLSMVPGLSAALGPMGLGLGTFSGVVALANMIAHAAGVPTTHQGLQGVQSNLRSTSESTRNIADTLYNATPTILAALNNPNGTPASNAASAQAGIDAALSGLGPNGARSLMDLSVSQGNQGISQQGMQAVPAIPGPLGTNSVSGLAGANAQGFGGLPGVTFSARGGLVGTPAINFNGTPQGTPIGESLTPMANPELDPPAAPPATPAPDTSDTGVPGIGPAPGIGESPVGDTSAVGDAAGAAPGIGDSGAGVGPGGPGQGGDAGDGGGGGGGGGAGCHLASWSLDNLTSTKDTAHARQVFNEFYQLWVRARPNDGKRLFAVYQRVAKQIIVAADKTGPQAAKDAQQYIYDHVVRPVGQHMEQKELPNAVRSLVLAVRTLAERFHVPPPRDVARFISTRSA